MKNKSINIVKIMLYSAAVLIAMFLYGSFNTVKADSSIEIYTTADLAAISQNPTGNYTLMNDLDMADIEWIPLEFGGTLDGADHTIYNLHLDNLSPNTFITVDWHHNEYPTRFASLFSNCENAEIKNLHLVNVTSDITTDEHCFIAGIAGKCVNTQILNCSVSGRMRLTSSNTMSAIGGLAGFGEGYVANSSADIEAVIVDKNPEQTTEEFIGGIWATGYPTVENCTVVLRSYTTTFSYTHDGGIIGMHRVYIPGLAAERYISGCSVDVTLHYLEHQRHGHRHYGAVAGERINPYLTISDNEIVYFEKVKSTDYDSILQPCMCEDAEYTSQITKHTDTEPGYTTFTCPTCGYTYTDDYVLPGHIAGEWATERQATYEQTGLMTKSCTVCNEILEQKEIPKLEYVSSIVLDETSIEMEYKSTAELSAEIEPENAHKPQLIWSSSDEDIAKVNSHGRITAKGRGSAVITCQSADGNASAECQVDVKYSFKQWLIIILLFGWAWY